ncbi:MAG: hypothetical protein QM831_35520 [Kofleriaceae bacterium]
MRLFFLLVLVGCVSSESYVCGDRVCPAGQVCAPIPHAMNSPTPDLCVEPDAIKSCAGAADGAACDGGICHDGVCLPSACGNGYVDPGEQCDDGNQISNDGCSADCTSNETCGNGVRDGVKNEECDDGNLLDADGCDSKCQLETARWKNIAIDQLPALAAASMVYDSARDQMILFGGIDAPTISVNNTGTWWWTGKGWIAMDPRSHPADGYGAASAYDVAHSQIVLFGGGTIPGQPFTADTYLWNGRTWQFASPMMAPTSQRDASMVYDAKRKRIVMFGGHNRSVDPMWRATDQTWTWDGTTWTQLKPAHSPSPRSGAAMSYDPLRDQIVMFGGTTNNDTFGNPDSGTVTWIFDGTDWHSTTGTGPTPRYGARMAWDTVTHTTLLFGGNTSSTSTRAELGDTWAWNGTSWTHLSPTTNPPARDNQAMASNPAHGQIIMVGGFTTDPKTWAWNGSNWLDVSPVAPTGASTSQQYQTPYDIVHHQSVVPTTDGNTYAWDGLGWMRTAGVPDAGYSPSQTYDLARDQVIQFGGEDSVDYDTTWTWSPSSWTKSSAKGPPGRAGAAFAYDMGRKKSVLFGGSAATVEAIYYDDTWEWDGAAWTQKMPAHSPSSRYTAQLFYDPTSKQVVLFGGVAPPDDQNDTGFYTDTWAWDGSDWNQLMPHGAPQATYGGQGVWNPRRQSYTLFSSEANVDNGAPAATWEWKHGDWSPIPIDGNPPAQRGGAVTMISHDGSMQFFSGYRLLGRETDSWELTWDNASPAETCTANLDLDGDGLAGCADPDCFYACNPTCFPGTECDAAQPHCGDGTCSALENCRICPDDCGTCAPVCGDNFCDPGETAQSCPGDCP